ncbi:MAG: hypothetical protein IKZ08_03015 [Bacteroidales bacterium]|nr:hypothetical protein [Bacteroidales bacterium]
MKETKERLPFHMAITDNRTGEVVYELDACAIVGAVQTENEATAAIGLTACCDILDLAAVIFGAQQAQQEIMNERPDVLPLLMALAAADGKDEDEE